MCIIMNVWVLVVFYNKIYLVNVLYLYVFVNDLSKLN